MTRLLLTIFLALAICSCRSHKEVQTVQTYESNVEEHSVIDRDSLSQIITQLQSSTDIDIDGITVEFFPPDTLHPHIRNVPKSLHIDKMNVKNNTDAAKSESTDVTSQETVNLRSDTSSDIKQETRSEHNALSPPGWVLFFSVLILILCVSTFVYYKFFK